MKKELGNIKKVNLREAWSHEAYDFTNWLAEEENIAILSNEIGVEIDVLETEANVGSFNVDIFAENAHTEKRIIIENQLEATDHDHLGKLITYASGLDAEFVIWIVRESREEHRQAVDWLNDYTADGLNFFLIKIELWQIDDSPYAPKFDVISKPNDWASAALQSAKEKQLTETKKLQKRFWKQFKSVAMNDGVPYSLRKVNPRHWYEISIGTSGVHISLTVNTRKNKIGCGIYITDNDDLYDYFLANRDEIESKLGEKVEWMPRPEKSASRIHLEVSAVLTNEDRWDEYFEWLLNTSKRFYTVFRDELKTHD